MKPLLVENERKSDRSIQASQMTKISKRTLNETKWKIYTTLASKRNKVNMNQTNP